MRGVTKGLLAVWLHFGLSSVVLAEQQHFTTHSAGFQSNKPIALTPEVRKFIEDTRIENTVVGLSVAVIHPDGRVELEGFGNKTAQGDEVEPDTLFVLGSTSKAFTAASVGIVIDDFAQGRNATPLPHGLQTLDWQTKVKDILPDDWELQDEWASEKASIRDVLSHVSGLSRHDLQYQRNDTARGIVRRLRHLRPSWELREQYHYNNQMYILGSYIVSTYSGLPYPEFVKQRIFSPLGMSSSTYSQNEASKHNRLTQFFNAEGRQIPFWYPDYDEEMISGAGGVISSVRDLVSWVKLHLNGGVDPASHKSIISKSSFEAVTAGWSLVHRKGPTPGRSFEAYGHGWGRQSLYGHEIVSHDGALPGTSSQVAFLPNDGIGVVILSNTSNRNSQVANILLRILEELLRIPKTASAILDASNTVTDTSEPPQNPIQVVSDVKEQLPVEAYAGVYYDPAYYNITFCAPNASPPASTSTCQRVLADFSRFENVSASKDTLYAALSSFWIQEARLHRLDGNRFKLRPTFLFPEGYGSDRTPFELTEAEQFNSTIEFVVEDGKIVGFGLESVDVDPAQRKVREGGVKEAADAWFKKIQ